MTEKIRIEIIKGINGNCLAINDYRVAGPKVGVSGKVIQQWIADKEDVLDAFRTPDERHERLVAGATTGSTGRE